MYGSPHWLGAKYLADRNVILVIINYRVGPMGFLSFEDEIMPGNNGLRDQLFALKWVKKNIAKFGGNPESISLMGLSAGGASVHYHLLSPLSKGLFKNGISMSGTATCPWALVDNARERGLKFASSVGCDVKNGTEAILKCLKQRPAERLLRAVEQFFISVFSPFTPFGPVIEHTPSSKYAPFLPDAPLTIMKNGKQQRVPWMQGIVSEEGLCPVGSFIANEKEVQKFDTQFSELAPFVLDYNHTVHGSERSEVTRRVRKEYFGDKKVNNDTTKEIIRMASDRLFNVDAQIAAKVQAEFSPVYFYKLSRRPSLSFSEIITGTNTDYGTSHGDCHMYLFNLTGLDAKIKRTTDEKEFMEIMLDLWTSFANFKIMKPESKGVDWKIVDANLKLKYLNLDGLIPANMSASDDLGNVKFWTSLPIHEETQRLSIQ